MIRTCSLYKLNILINNMLEIHVEILPRSPDLLEGDFCLR